MRALNKRRGTSIRTVFFMDGAISAVGEGAGASVAEARDVVRVLAKVLRDGLDLEAAKPLVDGLPNHLVVLHRGFSETPITAGGCKCGFKQEDVSRERRGTFLSLLLFSFLSSPLCFYLFNKMYEEGKV